MSSIWFGLWAALWGRCSYPCFQRWGKLRHMLSRLPKWAGCRVTAMTLEYPSVSGNISHLLGLHDTCIIENGGVQFIVRGRTRWNAPLGVFWGQTAHAPHISSIPKVEELRLHGLDPVSQVSPQLQSWEFWGKYRWYYSWGEMLKKI